jgi:nitrite reductase/ring-hydroxylating ferredoxin subunit/uncharacterized membrane protein
MYGRGLGRDNGLVHELASLWPKVIPELDADVDGLWIHSGREVAVARLLARLIAAQDGWARPLGDFNHRWLNALFRPIRPIKDFLNGTWLGHPAHAAVTDIPIGTLLLAVVFDIAGQTAAADIALAATILFMLAAAVTGAADYTDTDGTARVRATIHSTLMVIALVVLLVSFGLRAAGATDRTIPIVLSIVALLIVTSGAFVGGDVVYIFGNMVSRHAFRGAGTKWIRLDTGAVTDLSTLPEATPTKMKAGINDLVLVRVGETVHALHAVCAHAGGPLAEGTVVDACIECPWHASRFRLSDGRLRRGPALYDQPAYELRAAESGGYEVRRRA